MVVKFHQRLVEYEKIVKLVAKYCLGCRDSAVDQHPATNPAGGVLVLVLNAASVVVELEVRRSRGTFHHYVAAKAVAKISHPPGAGVEALHDACVEQQHRDVASLRRGVVAKLHPHDDVAVLDQIAVAEHPHGTGVHLHAAVALHHAAVALHHAAAALYHAADGVQEMLEV